MAGKKRERIEREYVCWADQEFENETLRLFGSGAGEYDDQDVYQYQAAMDMAEERYYQRAC
jgi:hypothetical protein